MSEIGLRAARAIREMAKNNETSVAFEMSCLKAHQSQINQYERCISDPGAAILANMARNGYDVIYILTGERGTNAD